LFETSSIHRYTIFIGIHFNESSITDPESFYKDKRGWNILFSIQVRKKGEKEFQDVTFAFTTNDNRNIVEMMVMFDNPNKKDMAEIFSINYKGMTDYDFLDDIAEVRNVCIESAVLIAE